eukprot:TRINITY_DN515_c0_g1_i4.p1 TRINITY_DN515_c0_g1~~TRINITY_DN515_c0_g1_i4.p1  ORF type:complete len:272 (+),score=78.25 TRINITY_DN515_c0_g1_i4:53-817(+)
MALFRLLAPAFCRSASLALARPRIASSFFQSQVRCFSQPLKLNDLQNNPGSTRQSKRVGRGIGSGKGKTAGRGHKGQKARSGSMKGKKVGFEGGQTPLSRRMPRRGFNNPFRKELKPLNLDRLQQYILDGRIDATKVIDLKAIHESGIVGKVKHGVSLLARGASNFTSKIQIQVTHVSDSAKKAVEGLGGKVDTVYYTRLGLRAHLKPEKFDILPRNAAPPPRLANRFTIPQPFPAAPARRIIPAPTPKKASMP